MKTVPTHHTNRIPNSAYVLTDDEARRIVDDLADDWADEEWSKRTANGRIWKYPDRVNEPDVPRHRQAATHFLLMRDVLIYNPVKRLVTPNPYRSTGRSKPQ